MANVNGKKFIDQSLAQIRQRTGQQQRVAVAFDIDNTLFDTRGRALAMGKAFDKANGTTYFKGVSRKSLGNDAKETGTAVKMTAADQKKFSAFWFRNFTKGENFKNDTNIRQTVQLAKSAARAGADVYYVTARTQSEEGFTIAQLKKAGLPTVDADFVVSKAKFKDKTPQYKAAELTRISEGYDFVPWFITESKADLRAIVRLDAPVTSVLLETKFSGTGKVDEETPVWPVDVK